MPGCVRSDRSKLLGQSNLGRNGMNQEWRVLSQKTLLLDRWINVRADSCVTPSGRKIEPYYVLTYPDWVNVVTVTRDDCMVMIRQYRHAANKIILELPGG